ncbi:hypothetical protein L6R50_20205 [Myxococcota bacterium]|nr:hypothetical protein [Myxococcota bacterium]
MLGQLLSLLGAGMVLLAYLAYQRGWLGREDRLFNGLNAFGSGLLAFVALEGGQWGLILVEAAWCALSIPPLLRPPRRLWRT